MTAEGRFVSARCVLLAAVLVAGVLAGAIPALLAYRRALSDGLSLRI